MKTKTKIITLIIIIILTVSSISSILYFAFPEDINRAPVISDLPDQILDEDSILLDAIDLDDYSFDPDLDLLTYSIIGNTDNGSGVSIDGENRIDINPVTGWYGVSLVNIEVSDGMLKDNDTFSITRPRINTGPIIINYYPFQDLTIQMNETQEFNILVFDPDGDNMTYAWFLDDMQVGGNQSSYTFNASSVPLGIHILKVNITDGEYHVGHDWTIKVVELNWNLDDLDLRSFATTILNLSSSEKEVFRVYNYSLFESVSDILWKYTCFDEYDGNGWHSTSSLIPQNTYNYSDYYSNYYPERDLLKIKMPISTETGVSLMVIPSLFPTPFIMENSINAPNLDTEYVILCKDEYNCTSLVLSFTSDDYVNMTYEIFGLERPTYIEINNSAMKAFFTPTYIQNKYLQLPPIIDIYKLNNPFFNTHFNILNGTINNNDNAFMVANKIRTYLQTNFNLAMNLSDYSPAPGGRDVVDWFCETQKGTWADFASAFCAFTRAFGVASRFIDGFNSKMIEEFFDNTEGQFTTAIKYKNLYCWAEIFVPTDVSGDGKWIQMDLFDEFILGGSYNLTVSLNQSIYHRSDIANVTATLSSKVGDPIANQTITFTDLTTGKYLGQQTTNITGQTSILINLNESQVVGPHLIEAKLNNFIKGYNLTTIIGNISIILTSVNPDVVDISDVQPDTTRVQGYVVDPLNGKRIKDMEVNIFLFQNGTDNEISNAFSPASIVTNSSGDFDKLLDLNPIISAGHYEIRADFNCSWWIDTPFGRYSYLSLSNIFQVPFISFTNYSNRMEFNVTDILDVKFYIDGVSTNNPTNPIVSRYHTLNLTAQVNYVGAEPKPNILVNFYDYSRGDVFIGADISDIKGIASITYSAGDYCRAGPNLLYVRVGLHVNYSYFVLNEEPTINIISGPTPRVINRTGGSATQFNIVGEIFDSISPTLPISFSEITLKLLKGGLDYSSYLVPSESYPYQTGPTGTFNLTFGVNPTIPLGNYTLRLDFNGTIDLSLFPYSYSFNLPFINTSTVFTYELQTVIPATLHFSFWIDGIPSDDPFNPVINRYDDLNLTAFIQYGSVPIADGEWVFFYDVTQDNLLIGSDQTFNGIVQVTYSTGISTTAGPHLIYAIWNNKYNYSYFILDAPINVNLDICPYPRNINRTSVFGRNFVIHGYLEDSLNGNSIKNSEISVLMYDGPIDMTSYLVLESGSIQLGTSGEIDLIYSVISSIPDKNYTLQVRFNGLFTYTDPNYPHVFNLNYISNFNDIANGIHHLRVLDPNDIDIFFKIEGNPTLLYYNDINLPERFNRGDIINFSIFITQSGVPVTYGTVRIYDVYNNQLLDSHLYTGAETPQGYHEFLIDTTTWHAGLHQIKINWSSYENFNSTYIIINETINIFATIDQYSILRDLENFIVSGTVRESGELLRGLKLNIILLDIFYSDVSGLYLIGSQTLTINNDGSYQFFNSIDISCPQGEYYLNITFTGGIDAPGISINDYMIHNSSLLIPINITARTSITGNYETRLLKDDWYYGDNCYVYGHLTWDNGTSMVGMEINITIRDGMSTILATKMGFTDNFGFFNVSFEVGLWGDDTEVWVSFFSWDNFNSPEFYYIEVNQQELFRQT